MRVTHIKRVHFHIKSQATETMLSDSFFTKNSRNSFFTKNKDAAYCHKTKAKGTSLFWSIVKGQDTMKSKYSGV